MYAVIKTGGKQYRVCAGEQLQVEKLPGAEGDLVEFNEVLLVGEGSAVEVGKPLIAGGVVRATVISHGRSDKVSVIKFKRRTTYKRMHNHRQHYTLVKIDAISGGSIR